jgi:hypothetical protein
VRLTLFRAERVPLAGDVETVDVPLLPGDTVLSVEVVEGAKIPCIRIRINHR